WSSIDIYVSLHHAEGFGLTVAEAMARGIPVVATGAGATAEFCDTQTAWPVVSRQVRSAPVFDLNATST
ncbi:glycosyltransferase, partial [Streptococcus pneumoniae]